MAITNKLNVSERWLLAILVLLPTYLIRFTIFGIPLNLLDILIGCGFLHCVIYYRGLRVSPTYRMMAITFLLIGLVAIVVSDAKLDALGVYKSYLLAPILVGAMIQTIRPQLQHVLQALGSCLLFIGSVAVLQWLTGYGIPAPWNVGGIDVRVTSIFEYPNAVGLLAAPIVAMSLAWLVHEQRQKVFFLIVALVGTLAIGLSHSDGAVVAVIAALGFTLLFTRHRTVVISISVLVFAIALLLPPVKTVILLQDSSGEVRLALWEGTMNLLRDRPIFGAGLANFPNVYPEYKLDRHVELLLYPHNILLDFWVELGLAGVVWLVCVLTRFFKRGLQGKKYRHHLVLMAGMVAMLMYGLVDVPYFKNDLSVVFWVLLALNDVLPNTRQE